MTMRAGPGDGKKTLLVAKLPAALASRALGLFCARSVTRSVACGAMFRPVEADFLLDSRGRLLQGDLELKGQISSLLRKRPPAAAGSKDVSKPEQIPQNIFKISENRRVKPGKTAEALAPQAVQPEAVIGRPLLRVPQNAVGFGCRLKILLRLPVAGVAVRVVFEGELPVGPLDLIRS